MTMPTPRSIAYAWHEQAIGDLSLHLDLTVSLDPCCGWFKRRLVKGGPFVAARIWLDAQVDEAGDLVSDEVMRCEVDGERRDPESEWSWLCGQPITESEFDWLSASVNWARAHSPGEPMANPREPVDWARVPTPDFERR